MPHAQHKVAPQEPAGFRSDREGDLEFFGILAEAGSLVVAARRLGVSRSAVSKRLSRLESRLGVSLANRSARSFELSEAGRLYHAEALRFAAHIDEVEEQLRALSDQPRGRIRIGTSVGIMETLLLPALGTFLRQHGEIDLQILPSGHAAGFIDDHLDCQIIAGHPDDSGASLTRVDLLDSPFLLCASPDYLRRHPNPVDPRELSDHDCLCPVNMRNELLADWHFRRGHERASVRIRPRCSGPGLQIAHLARHGAGIARLPRHLVSGDLSSGRLRPVMQDWQDPRPRTVHLLYDGRTAMPLRTRLLIEHLRSTLEP